MPTATEHPPDLDASGKPVAATPPPDFGYGNRYNSTTPKGLGYLGPLQRADGNVMSEYSIGVNLNGKEMEIPSIVPTLNKSELQAILMMKEGDKMPASITQKAVDFAKSRLAKGQDPFAAVGEQQALYPDLKRAEIPKQLNAPAPTTSRPPDLNADRKAVGVTSVLERGPSSMSDGQQSTASPLNQMLEPLAHPKTLGDFLSLVIPNNELGGEVGQNAWTALKEAWPQWDGTMKHLYQLPKEAARVIFQRAFPPDLSKVLTKALNEVKAAETAPELADTIKVGGTVAGRSSPRGVLLSPQVVPTRSGPMVTTLQDKWGMQAIMPATEEGVARALRSPQAMKSSARSSVAEMYQSIVEKLAKNETLTDMEAAFKRAYDKVK